MRWMAVVLAMVAMGCGVESAEVAESDAEARMNTKLVKKKPMASFSLLGIDCDDPDYWDHPWCDRINGSGFNSSASGDPNVHPGDWHTMRLEGTKVSYMVDERGSVHLSNDDGETTIGIIDDLPDVGSLIIEEVESNEGAWVSVNVYGKDADGHVFSFGTLDVQTNAAKR